MAWERVLFAIDPSGNVLDNSVAWAHCWTSVEHLPDTTYTRVPAVIPDIVRALLRSNVSYWTPTVADSWRSILNGQKPKPNGPDNFGSAPNALRFCFHNNYYRSAPLLPRRSPWFTQPFQIARIRQLKRRICSASMIGNKAKTLRKDLIQAFVSSPWNPGTWPSPQVGPG